jgi:hypothetical protein
MFLKIIHVLARAAHSKFMLQGCHIIYDFAPPPTTSPSTPSPAMTMCTQACHNKLQYATELKFETKKWFTSLAAKVVFSDKNP